MAKHLWFMRRTAAALCTTAITVPCSPESTVAPAVATTLTALESSANQVGTVAHPLASPLTVTLTDQNGDAMAGVTIAYAIQSGGGSLDVTSVVTDASGQASAQLTLGTVAGENSVIASTSTGLSATFTATANAVDLYGSTVEVVAMIADDTSVSATFTVRGM